MLTGLLAVSIALLIGCGQRDQISTYTIPTTIPDVLVQQDRMLGGIVPAGEKVWFYKLVADVDDVAMIEPEFKAWVEQLRYENDSPLLDTPDSWTRISAGMMQHAKFQIPAGDRVIEMSVSELGNSGDWNDQVTANVNRWRGQMGLEPDSSPLAGGQPLELEHPPSSDQAIWVSIDGVFQSGRSMGGGPMSGGGGPMSASAQGPVVTERPSEQPSADPKYRFELPTGWTEGKAGGMRLAAFDVATDAGPAEVTLIEAGGDVEQNIGMWLGQVKQGSTPEDAAAVVDEGEEVTVLGLPGTRFRLYGDEASEKAIDVTMVPLEGGSSLFIKMTGVPAAVKASDKSLTDFLRTIKTSDQG